jgi:LuxR family maltose regulon positive regulatory protein
MARLRAAEGDLDSALELLDEAERVYNGDYSPNVQPVPAVRARLRIRRGELGHADAWAAQRELAPDDELSYLREYEHVTYARLLLARHRARPDESTLGDAEGLLVRLLTAAEEGGREGSVIEILVLRSLGCHARRDVPASLAALGRAVKLAEPEGYLRIFADEGPSIAVVLEALLKQGTATGYVRDLLAATIGQRQPVRPAQALVDPLSDRELDVLRLLGSDLDGPDIARELSVSLNTMRTHTKNIYAARLRLHRSAHQSCRGRTAGLVLPRRSVWPVVATESVLLALLRTRRGRRNTSATQTRPSRTTAPTPTWV